VATKTGSKDTAPAKPGIKGPDYPGTDPEGFGGHPEGIQFISFDENVHSIYDDLAECQGGIRWA